MNIVLKMGRTVQKKFFLKKFKLPVSRHRKWLASVLTILLSWSFRSLRSVLFSMILSIITTCGLWM